MISVTVCLLSLFCLQRSASTDIGWPSVSRKYLDSYKDGVIVPEPAQNLIAGLLREWTFYVRRGGRLNFQLWRPTNSNSGLRFKLIYQKSFSTRYCGVHRVQAWDNVVVKDNDVTGFESHTVGIIPYNRRTCNGLASLYAALSPTIHAHIGVTYNFTRISNLNRPCRKYSISTQIHIGPFSGNAIRSRATLDTWNNTMYIPEWFTHVPRGIPAKFQIYAARPGTVYLQIFRKVATLQYKIVAQWIYQAVSAGPHEFTPAAPQATLAGDVIGFFFPGVSFIPFDGWNCTNERGIYVEAPTLTTVKKGETFTFKYMESGLDLCRSYSIRLLMDKAPVLMVSKRSNLPAFPDDPNPRG